MISINHFGGGKAAKNYFSEHLSKGDYFAKDAELLQPRFDGLTADVLGIRNQTVTQETFFNLVDNKHPVTGQQLTSRLKLNRRAMTDITFDAPKGVTLAALTDSRVAGAVDQAIDETMREIETAMCVRVRKGGKDHDRVTGNLLYVKWPHATTRPLADGKVDPHHHVHVTCLNISYDPIEKIYKAAQFGDIVRDKGFYQAAFHARLAGRLAALAYGVEREGKSFRLLGIEKATCEKFSRRTAVIEERAKALGITDADAKAKLGRMTRNRKADELGSEELRREWLARLTPAELKSLKTAGTGIHKGRGLTAKEAMDYAVEQSFERNSVITEKALVAAALVQGVGSVTVEDVQKQIRAANIIRKEKGGVTYVTTKKVYEEELQMVGFARDGRGTCAKLSNRAEISDGSLSAEQRKAALEILHSRDRVIGLSGRAGTGKTRMMQATVQAIEAAGQKVNTFAPSAEASRGVLRSEGFANADTVERLLTDRNLQRQVSGQVLWVDEAGLLSVKDTQRLFALAKENKNRVILSGDTKQHTSVARGDALRLIEKDAGLRFAELREIRRQKNDAYRSAVGDISKGELTTGNGRTFLQQGIEKLDAMGAVVECQGEERYQKVADDYLAAGPQTALVITPTHAEGAKVTERIRAGLKQTKRLVGHDKNLDTLQSVNWTEAERKDALNYEPGMVVQFHQNAKGFKRGDKTEVIAATTKGVTVRQGSKTSQLPIEQAERFQVYRKHSMPVAAGETIRITQNSRLKTRGRETRLNNGAVYQVAGFTDKGALRLSNGFVLPKDYGHLAYGYTSTSHASQGKTVDKVFISMSQDSLSAASREQFYVSLSRGREGVKLYTDDKQAMFEAVQKSGARMSATELLGKPDVRKQLPSFMETLRVRKAYQAIKERAQEAIRRITPTRERTHVERKRA